MKTYRGSPTAARNYVEVGRARADDYYLTEGTGIAERYAASSATGVRRLAPLSGDEYEAWVAGLDPETGVPKGRLRHDENAVRFVEIVVNGPKSWSLVAELHPDISTAYDAAQDRAAEQILAWLAAHATTRVGPRGAQLQVPVAEVEAAVVRHYTSRAGDPHRHLHLQINARVFAEGAWRGLHTVGVRDSLDALNGIGHAAVMTDPGFRAALAGHGYALNPATGEVAQLQPFVGAFSARAAQIGRNIDRYETDWRAANPGREPGRAVRRAWDARAWADARPDKVTPRDGAELTRHWVAELRELGYRDPAAPAPLSATSIGVLDRDQTVREVLARLAARRSGWNAADIRGEVAQLIARRNVVTDPAVRCELAEDLTARALARCVPLVDREGVPEHIRALSSAQVLDIEADLTARLASRANTPAGEASSVPIKTPASLDTAQRHAVGVLAGDAALVLIEGAAGAGKTTTLAATRAAIEQAGHRLVVVTPTRKAAEVAARELGTPAFSAAWLAHQHGYRWDEHGAWTRLRAGERDEATGTLFTGPSEPAQLNARDLVLIDEAGMLDQDTARALLTLADEHRTRIALVGDRHQLPAVGRGGVLDLAARWVGPDTHISLDAVHRFVHTTTSADGATRIVPDEEYASLSLQMRWGAGSGGVFDALVARGQIHVHASEPQRLATLGADSAQAIMAGHRGVVIADTREQVAALNAAIRDRLIDAGFVANTDTVTTNGGQQVSAGDRVATRRNDTDLAVANRDTWTITHVHHDGTITVTGGRGVRTLPADYVREHIELAYATTVYGAQGETSDHADLVLGEHTTAAAAYVGMTRGRARNTAHLVADTTDNAREQWVAAFARDRADLGAAAAAEAAATEAARYAPQRPVGVALRELRAAWSIEAGFAARLSQLETRAAMLDDVVALTARRDATVPALKDDYQQARMVADAAQQQAARIGAEVAAHAAVIGQALRQDWDQQRLVATRAAQIVHAGPGRLGQHLIAVRRATEDLAAWSLRWQPYLPAMPTRTDDIAWFASRSEDTSRAAEAFERHAREIAERSHPDYAAARTAASAATGQLDQSSRAYTDARGHYSLQLSHYGNLAYLDDPAGQRDETQTHVAEVRADLAGIRDQIRDLVSEPALRTLTPERIAAERATWSIDRDTARQATYRRSAQLDADTRTPGISHEPWAPPAPEHSHGISR